MRKNFFDNMFWAIVSLLGWCFLYFVTIQCKAQTTPVPNVILDSMIWEVQRGRQCSVVIEAQANEIEKLGAELMHTNTALELKNSETQTLEGLLENAKKGNEVLGMQFALDKKKLKRKVRNRNLLIIGETALIIILLL